MAGGAGLEQGAPADGPMARSAPSAASSVAATVASVMSSLAFIASIVCIAIIATQDDETDVDLSGLSVSGSPASPASPAPACPACPACPASPACPSPAPASPAPAAHDTINNYYYTNYSSSSCSASSAGSTAAGLHSTAAGLHGVAHAFDSSITNAWHRYAGLAADLKPIGYHTAMAAEASDAGSNMTLVKDGQSGDTDFPFMTAMKPLLTIGEYDPYSGYMPVGVPDGMGAMLKDDMTVRIIFQAESYGKISQQESWPQPVNDAADCTTGACFTGSHVTYLDYEKAGLQTFLNHGESAASLVKGAGSMIEHAYNLAGKKIGKMGGAADEVHYGDTGADGTFVSAANPGIWTWHSFCAAHLEEKEQWGTGIGLKDDVFITNEEWTTLDAAKVASNGFVGLSAQAIDMSSKTAYAVGAMGMGGYEKIVEFSCGVTGWSCFSLSGYNGAFSAFSEMVTRKQAVTATRADGSDWVFPQNIVPARIYIGKQGYKVDGTACDIDDDSNNNKCSFLEKNGLAYGKVYGFAIANTAGDRDAWHKDNDRSITTTMVDGIFAPTAWQWDGTVRDFEHDQSWDFQEPPVIAGAAATAGWDASSLKFWTAKGRDAAGAKTEHNSPDPRGKARFLQSSTAGYMGIYAMTGASSDTRTLKSILEGLSGNNLPDGIPATYELLEGEIAVNDRIELGGKGKRADGADQTKMKDSSREHSTFEDIDGLEWFAAADDRDFVVIQEDGGNSYGERMMMFEIPKTAGTKPTYKFLAMAGGSKNTRSLAGVGVPAGTHSGSPSASEFSGAFDLSGILKQTSLGGAAKRAAEATVDINSKVLVSGLQMHQYEKKGAIANFRLDRGGAIYAFKPKNF